MNPQQNAARVAAAFTRLHHEQLAGIPVLNNRLRVECFGFQLYRGRVVGILITPWLMNLILLPAKEEDWIGLKPGSKQEHRFPASNFLFMLNRVDGIGCYQAHSLYSSMYDFRSQEHAREAAQSFLRAMMVEAGGSDGNRYAGESPGRILSAAANPYLPERLEVELATRAEPEALTRRDLLRGSFIAPE